MQKDIYTYNPRTHRVTCWPLSRHFSGLASLFLHLRNATLASRHLLAICFDAAIKTADVGIGSPAASTVLAITIPNHNHRWQFFIRMTRNWLNCNAYKLNWSNLQLKKLKYEGSVPFLCSLRVDSTSRALSDGKKCG